MISDAILLQGSIDAKYANFFLSLIEENKHNSLITNELVQEFCSGTYEYPDEFSVTGVPDGWTDKEDWYEVFHMFKHIEENLSRCLRKTYYNDAVFPMERDSNFNSVFPNFADYLLFGFRDDREVIKVEMSLDCWNLLKRVCKNNQSTWETTLNS